jgi:hypothetical protein
MRRVIYRDHEITLQTHWDGRSRCWSCAAIVCSIDSQKSTPVFDTFRSYKIKARAVTAILNVARQWIDEGKRQDIFEQ